LGEELLFEKLEVETKRHASPFSEDANRKQKRSLKKERRFLGGLVYSRKKGNKKNNGNYCVRG